MNALYKTLFGSTRTVLAAAAALLLGFAALHGPLPEFAGIIFPVALFAGVAYLTKH